MNDLILCIGHFDLFFVVIIFTLLLVLVLFCIELRIMVISDTVNDHILFIGDCVLVFDHPHFLPTLSACMHHPWENRSDGQCK